MYSYTPRPSVKPDYRFSVSLPNNTASFKEYNHEGNRYIEGRRGTEYVLKFYNGSTENVEVVFSVDGLSVVDGKPAGVGSTGYIVRPYQSLEVPGWRINSDKVAKFVFRPQGDVQDMTYVEALRSEGVKVDVNNQGIIGCLVFKEKYVEPVYHTLGFNSMGITGQSFNTSSSSRSYNANRPRGFSAQSVNSFTSNIEQMSVGTGFGDDKAFKTQNVQFTRDNNYSPTVQFTIQYDTLKGLRRRGVPVDYVAGPNAFPASPHLNTDGCRIPKNR